MSILPRWLGGRERRASLSNTPPEAPVPPARQESARLVDLANLAEDGGDLTLALTRLREAIEADPRYARAHLNLGNVLLAGGDIGGAISATVVAIRVDEQNADAHYNLGRLYGMTGDAASAEACFRKAIELRPQFPKAVEALGGHLIQMNRADEAKSWLRRALADDPHNATASLKLSRLLIATGNIDEAEQELRRAVEINPNFTEGHCLLADLCVKQRRRDEAIEWCAKALATGNSSLAAETQSLLARTQLGMGILLVDENRWAEAEVQLRSAMALLPDSAAPYAKLASMEMRMARPIETLELLEKAIAREPAAWNLKSFRLFALNLRDDIEPQELFAEHRRFGEWLEGTIQRTIRTHSNSIDEERILRVGYMSGDFRVHPVMVFMAPLLDEHDRARVQPFCYSNVRDADEVTHDLERRFAGTWRNIAGLSDDEVADLIAEDGIDILVDLSGHTEDSRLPVFAHKPAPIQVSWLGYLNTTGLKSMDYRLVDRFTDPIGVADTLHTERLVRLPDSQWAYWPLFEVPILPAERAKSPREILFGSFNQFMKLSDRSLELWAQVLAKVPDARLRVAGLPPGDFEDLLLRRLETAGIDHARVRCTARVPVMQYLRAFNEVDIALDSMPYNGATTTLDTLWMGVPVVGLMGTRSISRGTYSILKTLGMDELIATSPEEYVDLNVRLATNNDWRDELHRTLREKLRRSALMDIARFTENLESAYRTMWREWCKSQCRNTET
jgi:protein O-GlcNAc transferase